MGNTAKRQPDQRANNSIWPPMGPQQLVNPASVGGLQMAYPKKCIIFKGKWTSH